MAVPKEATRSDFQGGRGPELVYPECLGALSPHWRGPARVTMLRTTPGNLAPDVDYRTGACAAAIIVIASKVTASREDELR